MRIMSPGCDKMHAKRDAMKAAVTETTHFVLDAVRKARLSPYLWKKAYSSPAKTSNETCFPKVYGTYTGAKRWLRQVYTWVGVGGRLYKY